MSTHVGIDTNTVLGIVGAINRSGGGKILIAPRDILRFLEGGVVYANFGKVIVSVRIRDTEGQEACELSWPGIGDVGAHQAMDFAQDLMRASHAAAAINSIVTALPRPLVEVAAVELRVAFSQVL